MNAYGSTIGNSDSDELDENIDSSEETNEEETEASRHVVSKRSSFKIFFC